MINLMIFLVSTVTGSLGWWLGDLINVECAFLLSTAGGLVGIYYGWKWGRAFS